MALRELRLQRAALVLSHYHWAAPPSTRSSGAWRRPHARHDTALRIPYAADPGGIYRAKLVPVATISAKEGR